MSKQDRQGSRTPADLDRRYSFGKTFAEMLEATDEAKKAAEKAMQSFDGLNQDQIFNLLTNNGASQGLYRADGDIYINASYIKAGVIASQNHSDEYSLINDYLLGRKAGQYHFSYDDVNYSFTLNEDINNSFRMEFYRESLTLVLCDVNNRNTIYKTLNVIENSDAGELIKTMPVAYLPNQGTIIDLSNGEIKNKQFGVMSDGRAFFAGELSVDDGRIGELEIIGAGLVGDNSGVTTLLSGSLLMFSTYEYNMTENVSFSAGSIIVDESLGFDPNVIEISNSSGDKLKVVPKAATLTGKWKATPYISGSGLSEIVTKQDLISLGLIT